MTRERRAYICAHEDHAKKKIGYRVFLLPGETVDARACPDHGKRAMKRQENKPYKGSRAAT